MYMTLITAMLVMIYKRENNIGYTTAVRRMGIEPENLIMAIIVIESGGRSEEDATQTSYLKIYEQLRILKKKKI